MINFPLVRTAVALVLGCSASFLSAATFDFETPNQLGSILVSGNKTNFIQTTEKADTGTQSLRFNYDTAVPDAFQSFTYDIPISMTAGTISVWFYDAVGATAGPFPTKYGGSIILENAASPADFLAVEVWDGPYPTSTDPTPGAPNYYVSKGTSSPVSASLNTRFFGDRSIGWHQVVFTLSGSSSTISVDGVSNSELAPSPLTGPGTTGNTLRLRFMAGSPSNGGSPPTNWTTNPPALLTTIGDPYLYYDDITFNATAPAVASAAVDFIGTGVGADYDIAANPMISASNDNTFMHGFVPSFGVTTAQAHAGTQSAKFVNAIPPLKAITFDLTMTGTATFRFYDSLGGDTGFNKLGGSVLVEKISDPSQYVGFEVWNGPYPTSDFNGGSKNYYSVIGSPAPPVFFSNYYGDRSIGWHTVSIDLTSTTSKITIDGVENMNGSTGIKTGPGVSDGIRLKFMPDSASCGGAGDYTLTDELNLLYALPKTTPYVYFDNISIPSAGMNDWTVY